MNGCRRMLINGIINSPIIVAEVGASHNGSLDRAMETVRLAHECGADMVKFQLYTADDITIRHDSQEFVIQDGPWKGWQLWELYHHAATPIAWFLQLFEYARKIGIVPFASVFSPSGVDCLERLDCPAYKISSFEFTDIPLIKYVARKGKPLMLSMGMSSDEEREIAYEAARNHLEREMICMMHCISAYPCPPEDAGMANMVGCEGLSDHTLGSEAAIIAAVMGSPVIEKHLTLSRKDGGVDDGFASEPEEFAAMVRSVRLVSQMVNSESSPSQEVHRNLRRSVYVVKDIARGEKFTHQNLRSIRPGYGLSPSELPLLIGAVANRDLKFGMPMKREYVL